MKKLFLRKLALFFAACLLSFSMASCHHDSEEDEEDTPEVVVEPDNTDNPVEVIMPTVSFNLSNATALASGDSTTNRSAREAATVSTSFLQKVLSNGSLDSAFSIEGGEEPSRWSKLEAVIKSPYNSDYILYFDDWSYTAVTLEDGSGDYWNLSQAILVHSDNSYEDILLSDPLKTPNYMRKKDNIKFMKDGTILYVCDDGGAKDFYLNKYDPSTKTTTEVCHISNESEADSVGSILGFQLSNDDKYIYLNCANDTECYLKVFPLNNPNDVVVLGKVKYGVHGWTYNPYDDYLYYSVRDGNKEALKDPTPSQTFKVDKTGKGTPEVILDDFCYSIVSTAKDQVWTIYAVSKDESTKTATIKNILDSSDKIEFDIPSNFEYHKKYIQVGTNFYLEYHHYQDPNQGNTLFENIYSINTTSMTGENVMQKVPHWDKIALSSWSVNENYLFIAGTDYTDNSAANYKIDLTTLEPTKIDSGTAFACIAAL